MNTFPPPIYFVLDRLRSAHNVGNILRLAEAIDAVGVMTCGHTPAPPHPKLAKSAMGAERMVACRPFPDTLGAIADLRRRGVSQVVAVDTGHDAIPIWDFEFRFPLALVLGNEAMGIDPTTIAACDAVVEMPMFGQKTSFNVGNAAAIAAYFALAPPQTDNTVTTPERKAPYMGK